jgi:hypothetical protein
LLPPPRASRASVFRNRCPRLKQVVKCVQVPIIEGLPIEIRVRSPRTHDTTNDQRHDQRHDTTAHAVQLGRAQLIRDWARTTDSHTVRRQDEPVEVELARGGVRGAQLQPHPGQVAAPRRAQPRSPVRSKRSSTPPPPQTQACTDGTTLFPFLFIYLIFSLNATGTASRVRFPPRRPSPSRAKISAPTSAPLIS